MKNNLENTHNRRRGEMIWQRGWERKGWENREGEVGANGALSWQKSALRVAHSCIEQ